MENMMRPKLTPTTNDLNGNGLHASVEATIIPQVSCVVTELPVGERRKRGRPRKLPAPLPDPIQPIIPLPEPAKEPEHLKIAIIGTAPSSRSLAPVNDPSWKIWACSAGNQNMLSRVDCWFEIHSNLLWEEHRHFGVPYLEWLNKQTFPIYMQDNSLVSRAMSFPKDELIKEFGRWFFTSSFAWMMAFAIKSGAKEIGLWGVDMASRDEYILQRSGGHFFIQEAIRRGITVHIPKESDLAQPPALYGFDDSTNFMRKICAREKELKDRLGPMKQQAEQLRVNISYLEGALEDVDYVKSIWGGAQSASAF